MTVLLGSLFLVASLARAADVPVPGSALHPPDRVAAPERRSAPESLDPALVDADGLYSYLTPFASPRWLRLQQDGNTVWGTIDINGPFGYCGRTRIDGWVSGDEVTFDVDLESTNCPCSGSTAALRFIGAIDGDGNITGTWANNCTPPTGSWWACRSADPPETGVCEPLPENDPPAPIALVPAAGSLALALMGLALAAWALVRRRAAAGGQVA